MTRFLRAAAVGVATASVLMMGALPLWDASWSLTSVVWPAPNLLVGLLLTYRRPRLVVGWLFAALAFLVASGDLAEAIAESTLGYGAPAPWWGVLAAWYGEVYWLSMIFSMLVFLPLLFPTGRAPTPRLRKVTPFIVAVVAVASVLAGFQQQLDLPSGRWVANPIGVRGLPDVEEWPLGPLLVVATVICLVTAFTALVVRFRRGHGVERQQIKWFTSAGAALILGFVAQGVLDGLTGSRIDLVDIVLFALPPMAAAVAIFRYRLYAIDRIISRTVTYAVVTALLVGVYLGLVTVLTAMTAPVTRNSPVAVATATLAAAALFRPARRRIQQVVDRRFNRAQYDAARTVEAFRSQMREDVDLDRLTTELVHTAQQVLQPQMTAVWLRPPEMQP